MPVVILHGPQCSGKTRQAPALLRQHRCTSVVDEWDGRTRLPADALAITTLSPPYLWPGAARATVIDVRDLPALAPVARRAPEPLAERPTAIAMAADQLPLL